MARSNWSRYLRRIRGLTAQAKNKFLPPSRLGLKFLAILSATLLLGALLSSTLILFWQHQQIHDTSLADAAHVSIVVGASLEHAMASVDKPMLYEMLQAIARETELQRLSILDGDGRPWLSSTRVEDDRLPQPDPLCRVCHGSDAAPSVSAVPVTQVSGETLVGVTAIPNQAACHACHGASAPSLGYIVTETPLANFQNQMVSGFWQAVVSTFLIFLLLAGLLTPSLGHLVIQPLVQLARSAREIGAGNLDSASRVHRNDEVGELAVALDTMRQQLKTALVEKESRNRELQMLNEIARSTNQLLDPQQILDLTIDIAVSSLGVQAGAIYLLDPECGRFTLHACQGMSECREVACRLWKFNQVLAGLNHPERGVVSEPIAELAANDAPRRSGEVALGEEAGKLWQDAQGRSFVGVPFRARGVLLGAMTLVTQPGQVLTKDGAQVLNEIGEQVGVALAHAMRFQNARNAATLEERERLAREMHDSLAQALGYIKLQTTVTDDLLSQGQIVQAQANLREVKELAKETYVDVREAIFGLRHTASGGAGFSRAIAEYLAEYLNEYHIHYGLHVQLQMDPDLHPFFSHQVSIQLTRIIQEALTNVRKHAQTKLARLSIEQIDHHWRIAVEDDGQGFDPQRVPPGGPHFLGLNIMRERAASIGAELDLTSRPGGGTSVVVRIPIKSEYPNDATPPAFAGR